MNPKTFIMRISTTVLIVFLGILVVQSNAICSVLPYSDLGDLQYEMPGGISLEATSALKKGLEAANEGSLEEAMLLLKEAILIDSDIGYGYLALGRILQEGGRIRESNHYFREFIRRFSDDSLLFWAHTELGRGLFILEENRNAALELEIALTIDPDYLEASILLGSVYGLLGNVDKATMIFGRAIEICRENAKSDSRNSYRYNLMMARALNLMGKYDEAETILREMTFDDSPLTFNAYRQLGTALQGMGRFEEAVECYNKIVLEHPNTFGIHVLLGDCFLALGDYIRAEEHYRKEIDLNPDNPSIYYFLGITVALSGNRHDAHSYYAKGSDMNPRNKLFPNFILNMVALGKESEVEKWLPFALQYHSEDALTYYVAGWFMYRKGDFTAAYSHIQKSMALLEATAESDFIIGSKSALLNDNGDMLIKVGKYSEAIVCLSQVVELNPTDQMAYYNLGFAYYLNKQPYHSIYAYLLGFESEPNVLDALGSLSIEGILRGEF